MKQLITPRLGLALALCGAVLPFALAGCGGGNGGLLGGRPNQTFALTPTTLTLPNGQTATISGTRRADNSASGQIVIAGAQARTLTTGAQNAVLAGAFFVPGTYDFTGTVNSAGVFDIMGLLRAIDAAANAPFRLIGNFPTNAPTPYTFTFNGIPETGTIAPPTTTPPVTPPTNPPVNPPVTPPVTPPTNPANNLTGTLTYSDKSAGNNFSPTSTDLSAVSQTGGVGTGGVINPTVNVTKTVTLTTLGDNTQVLNLDFSRNFSAFSGLPSETVIINLKFPALAGQTFAPGAARPFVKGDANFSGSIGIANVIGTTTFGSDNWELANAMIKVNSVSSDGKTINFTLSNALFQPATQTSGNGSAGTGTFTAAGTINAITP